MPDDVTEIVEQKRGPGQPPKWSEPKVLQDQIEGFFDYSKKEKKNPTVEGLCIYLDCDKQTILNYEKKDKFAPIIEKAKLRIADYVMSRALSGEINPTIAIWISKNHYGYTDKTEAEVYGKGGDPLSMVIDYCRNRTAGLPSEDVSKGSNGNIDFN